MIQASAEPTRVGESTADVDFPTGVRSSTDHVSGCRQLGGHCLTQASSDPTPVGECTYDVHCPSGVASQLDESGCRASRRDPLTDVLANPNSERECTVRLRSGRHLTTSLGVDR